MMWEVFSVRLHHRIIVSSSALNSHLLSHFSFSFLRIAFHHSHSLTVNHG